MTSVTISPLRLSAVFLRDLNSAQQHSFPESRNPHPARGYPCAPSCRTNRKPFPHLTCGEELMGDAKLPGAINRSAGRRPRPAPVSSTPSSRINPLFGTSSPVTWPLLPGRARHVGSHDQGNNPLSLPTACRVIRVSPWLEPNSCCGGSDRSLAHGRRATPTGTAQRCPSRRVNESRSAHFPLIIPALFPARWRNLAMASRLVKLPHLA